MKRHLRYLLYGVYALLIASFAAGAIVVVFAALLGAFGLVLQVTSVWLLLTAFVYAVGRIWCMDIDALRRTK